MKIEIELEVIYGEISNHGSTQTAVVYLPTGGSVTEDGDITDDLYHPYERVVEDVFGKKYHAIFEWKK